MKIGAKISVFNAELREARKRLLMSQADLAEAIGEPIGVVQFIETLKQPAIKPERVKNILQKMADILNVDFDVLFPEDYLFALQNKYLPGERNLVIVRDVNIFSLPTDNNYLHLPAPDEIVEAEQMQRQVREIVDRLPVKEASVVRYLYGFNDGEKHTIEETAMRFGMSRGQINQIETRALDRLRHPATRKALRDYVFDYEKPRRKPQASPSMEEFTLDEYTCAECQYQGMYVRGLSQVRCDGCGTMIYFFS
jgi:RNA polymerase sigma factor (sigma-70 family)